MNKKTSFAIDGAKTFLHAWFHDRMLEANPSGIKFVKNHFSGNCRSKEY